MHNGIGLSLANKGFKVKYWHRPVKIIFASMTFPLTFHPCMDGPFSHRLRIIATTKVRLYMPVFDCTAPSSDGLKLLRHIISYSVNQKQHHAEKKHTYVSLMGVNLRMCTVTVGRDAVFWGKVHWSLSDFFFQYPLPETVTTTPQYWKETKTWWVEVFCSKSQHIITTGVAWLCCQGESVGWHTFFHIWML